MLLDREPGDENCEVKIDPRQRGEAECNPEKVELFHGGNMRAREVLSRGFAITLPAIHVAKSKSDTG